MSDTYGQLAGDKYRAPAGYTFRWAANVVDHNNGSYELHIKRLKVMDIRPNHIDIDDTHITRYDLETLGLGTSHAIRREYGLLHDTAESAMAALLSRLEEKWMGAHKAARRAEDITTGVRNSFRTTNWSDYDGTL